MDRERPKNWPGCIGFAVMALGVGLETLNIINYVKQGKSVELLFSDPNFWIPLAILVLGWILFERDID